MKIKKKLRVTEMADLKKGKWYRKTWLDSGDVDYLKIVGEEGFFGSNYYRNGKLLDGGGSTSVSQDCLEDSRVLLQRATDKEVLNVLIK